MLAEIFMRYMQYLRSVSLFTLAQLVFVTIIFSVFLTLSASITKTLAKDRMPSKTLESLNIGYFPEWVSPNQIGQADQTFSKKMALPVHWHKMQTGTEMTEMLHSGVIDIAYAQGAVPFVVAVSEGVPLVNVGIAMLYADNDNCVVHNSVGINLNNAHLLEGTKIAVPLHTVSHYKALRILEHLNVDHKKIDFVDMNSFQGAEALKNQEVVMACGFGGGFLRMLEHGKELMSSDQLARIGVFTFDVVTTRRNFVEDYPEHILNFLQITEDFNDLYKQDPDKYIDTLAEASELNIKNTRTQLESFIFPTAEEVIHKWYNGNVAEYYQGIAEVLHKSGVIEETAADFSSAIDTSFLKTITGN